MGFTLRALQRLQASTINYEDALITLQLVLAKMQVSRCSINCIMAIERTMSSTAVCCGVPASRAGRSLLTPVLTASTGQGAAATTPGLALAGGLHRAAGGHVARYAEGPR
jgi:hypothetical protein